MVVFLRGKRLKGKVKSSPPFNDDAHDVVRWHWQRLERGQKGYGSVELFIVTGSIMRVLVMRLVPLSSIFPT